MKSTVMLLIGLLLTTATARSSEDPLQWVTFDRLCGSLEFFTPIAGGGNDAKPLKNVKIELYRWEEAMQCCGQSHLLFRTLTHKAGRYEFKSVDAGRYWLVAHWRRRAFHLPIVFTAKGSSSEDCESQGLDIDAHGDFGSWIRSTM